METKGLGRLKDLGMRSMGQQKVLPGLEDIMDCGKR